MKFKVGQKWQTRDGRVATIKSTTRDSENYPIAVTIGDDPFEWTYCEEGTPWTGQAEPHDRDLVRLIEEPPVPFKVGQKWETRSGGIVTITCIDLSSTKYPIGGQGEGRQHTSAFTASGAYYFGAKTPSNKDLVRLVSETLPDGWIEWNGGENPVPGAYVEYRMRNSETCEDEADDLRWDHHGTAGDIVAYKVTREAPVPESEPKPEPFTITEPGEYVTRDGRKVVVVALNLRGEFPVLGYTAEYNWDNACTWRADGRVYGLPSEHPRDIVDRWSPWANLDIDTPVWVKDDSDGEWVPRHFAGVSQGKATCWAEGLTSHTTKNVAPWNELSLAKPE